MNKQELIEKLKSDLTAMSEIKGKKYEYDRGYEQAIKEHLAMISNLDWPEKPKVPQFVADWYKDNQDDLEVGVYDLCVNLYNCDLEGKIKYWFDCDSKKPIETLVKMKLSGYEVEKKKLYTVEIPNPNGSEYITTYLGKYRTGEVGLHSWEGYASTIFANDWKKQENTQLTESEIKKDFEWAFRWAKEVEE